MNLGPSGFSGGNFGGGFNDGMGGGMRSRGGMKPGRGAGRSPMSGGGMMMKNNVQNSKTGHSVHMRGLPFEATVDDVLSFFSPLNPADVRLLYESGGRPKGECDVDFTTHADAESAMHKDKQNMGKEKLSFFSYCTLIFVCK